MLAQEGPLAGGQAETAFQLSTYCQYTLLGERQIDGPGHIAAGAADEERVPLEHPDDRIVAEGMDIPVMGQEKIGNSGKPFVGVIIPECDRLVGQIAACHHQGRGGFLKQKMLDRG